MFGRKDNQYADIKDRILFPRVGRVEEVGDDGSISLVDQPIDYGDRPSWLGAAEDSEQIIYEYSVNEDCYYAVIKDGDDRIRVAPGDYIAITKVNKIVRIGGNRSEQ